MDNIGITMSVDGKSNNWVKEFRRTIKTSVGSGWTVKNDRGNMLLIIVDKKDGRIYVNIPYCYYHHFYQNFEQLI